MNSYIILTYCIKKKYNEVFRYKQLMNILLEMFAYSDIFLTYTKLSGLYIIFVSLYLAENTRLKMKIFKC